MQDQPGSGRLAACKRPEYGRNAGVALLVALAPPTAVAYAALVPRFYLGGDSGWVITLVASPICFATAIAIGWQAKAAAAALRHRTIAWLAIVVGTLGLIVCAAAPVFTFLILSSLSVPAFATLLP